MFSGDVESGDFCSPLTNNTYVLSTDRMTTHKQAPPNTDTPVVLLCLTWSDRVSHQKRGHPIKVGRRPERHWRDGEMLRLYVAHARAKGLNPMTFACANELCNDFCPQHDCNSERLTNSSVYSREVCACGRFDFVCKDGKVVFLPDIFVFAGNIRFAEEEFV